VSPQRVDKLKISGTSTNVSKPTNPKHFHTHEDTEHLVIVDKPFKLETWYDYESFPESKGFDLIPWTAFTRTFEG
jgi:hypothetical protein